MIARMRKVQALVFSGDQEALLEALRRAGVVHVVRDPEAGSAELASVDAALGRGERTLRVLRRKGRGGASGADMPPEAIVDRAEELERQRERLLAERAQCAKTIETLRPWGDFDPARVAGLAAAGVCVRLYVVTRRELDRMKDRPANLRVIRRDGNTLYVAVIGRAGQEPALDAEEVRLPMMSLSGALRQAAEMDARLVAVDRELDQLSAGLPVVEAEVGRLRSERMLAAARLGLERGAGGAVAAMTGWVPKEHENRVAECLRRFRAWHHFSDPLPGEQVPVLLRNGPFVRMFEPVLRMLSLPDYCEIDPVPFFAPFLALFVGLCLGDAGYGTVLLLVSLAGRARAAPALKPVFTLTSVLCGCVILSGLALNSFFGSTLFGGQGITGALIPVGARWFSPLSPYEGPRGTVYPMMSFAIVLGIVQVFLGVALRAVNGWRSNGLVGALFPLSWFPLFFGFLVYAANTRLFGLRWDGLSAGGLAVGRLFMALPASGGLIMIAIGLAVFLLTNNPGTKVCWRPLRGLWELFNFCTGMLSSILSYLRLFALGLASGLLGSSFTDMAAMIIRRPDGSLDWLSPLSAVALVVLVAGHGVNLVLAVIGSIIHPLRLTFVEFLFNNLGFKGGSRPYEPLRIEGVQEQG